MRSQEQQAELTLFFDGACPLCSREARSYMKFAESGASLAFVDIAAPDFDATEYGLDPDAVHRTIHSKRRNGEVLRGIDTFEAIWLLIPRYRPFARIFRWPGLRQLLQLGYAGFAKIRPRLPGRSCESCQIPSSKARPEPDL